MQSKTRNSSTAGYPHWMQRSPPLLEKNCNAKLAEDLSKPINFCWARAKIPNPRLKHHPLGEKTSHWSLIHAFFRQQINQQNLPIAKVWYSPQPSSMSKASKNVDLSPSLNKANQLLSCKLSDVASRSLVVSSLTMSTVWGYCMRSIETDSYQGKNSSIIWSKVALGIPESSHVSL